MVKIPSTRILRIALNLALLTLLLTPSSLGEAGGSGWFVNTVDDLDDGLCDASHCSLREAINISNTTSGQQMIGFDIPGAAPHFIELCDVLPAVTDPVIFDGTLEPDYPYSGGPAVAIAPSQGATCAPPPYGLWIEASNTIVRGLSIVGFDQPAAPITGGIIIHAGTGSLVENSYIGLQPGGSPWGNRNGVLLGSAAHQILDNVVSGNTYGIHAFLGDQTIDGNYIGTDPDAMSTNFDLRNTIGVYIEAGADNNQIGLSGTGNVISGNGDGIYLGSLGNQIYSNMIGTNRTGTAALGNTIGIHAGQTTYTIIGGPDPALTNLISGNINGVSVGGYSTIQGNFIGTDFSGSAAIPNQNGISTQSSSYVLIGGTGTGQGNLISGNTNTGISIHDFATHIEVVRNKIGTDITGSGPLGNGRGIAIQGSGNFIGHVATDGGNTIAYNQDEGVMLTWSASQNRVEVNTIHDNGVGIYAMDDNTSANPFTENSIYANAALGIDLAPWGVNVNDPGDSDTGANQRLNYPVFSTLSTTSAAGTACAGCTVEVFKSDEDASGYGEGEALIGSVVVGPYGDFNITYPSPLAICDRITATATDAFGNTSEFSPNTPVGLCLVLDPSWLFLIEIIIFIIIWFAARTIGRRAGMAAGPAAAAGGAAAVVAALGVYGLMVALPFIELNPLWGTSPETPEFLPPCERFLAQGSMIPMEGARGMPIGSNGQETDGWMPPDRDREAIPPDPVSPEGGGEMPPDPLGHLNLSWTPLDPLKDDGEHGDMPDFLKEGGVQWRVELIGPTGAILSEVTTENAIPLSAFGATDWKSSDPMPFGTVMDDGEHGDGMADSFFDRLGGEPFFWRLTGEMPGAEGEMQPFCRPTNWMSFQLGAPKSLPALPWLAYAPPAPPPPAPSEPTTIGEGEAVPPEPCTPTITALVNLTCRSGPDAIYGDLGYLLQGESATVEGTNADSTWWWILNPDWQGHCWVWSGGADAACIPEDLAKIAAPALPSPEPPACTSDLDRDACIEAGGTYVEGGAAGASICQCARDG